MQSFDTDTDGGQKPLKTGETITVGRAEDIRPGQIVTVELSDGRELALCNVDGEFHATENFCPHKGAPLAEGILCGHTLECNWHGWQFDVRTGRCLTVNEAIEVYKVAVEDGWIRIEI